MTGIERYENAVLSGEDERLILTRLIGLIRGTTDNAGAVVLSIEPSVQAAAAEGLAGRSGAAFALNPQTGEVLSLYSSPSFDPNQIAQRNSEQARAYHESLFADPDRPLLNRATSETYPPGSVFKLITTAAALDSGQFSPNSELPGGAEFQLPLSEKVLKNADERACLGQDSVTLSEAFVYSCNTPFAWLGVELGDELIREQGRKFGFGRSVPLPMPVVASTIPTVLDDAQTALVSIGQYEVKATVVQMGLVAAAIANGGLNVEPSLVIETLGPDLRRLSGSAAGLGQRVISTKTAGALRQMMIDSVAVGTGTNARLSQTQVAGKTGTAETAPGKPNHAWFVGFAPAKNPTIAVAVVVEADESNPRASGNSTAAPIARSMIEAHLFG
jgi:peptidoglycan glycosyltransferase